MCKIVGSINVRAGYLREITNLPLAKSRTQEDTTESHLLIGRESEELLELVPPRKSSRGPHVDIWNLWEG